MVSLVSLWLPILLSAVGVFIVSSVIHMALGYHNNDYSAVPNEDQARAAMGGLKIPPGDYAIPKPSGMKEMSDPAFIEKQTQGPVVMMTVFPNQPWAMGKQLGMWFIYSAVVALFAGYVATVTLPAGTEYLTVFRVVGTVAFAGFGLAHLTDSIWYNRKWSTTAKNVFDALIYGLVTAGMFGWRWPG